MVLVKLLRLEGEHAQNDVHVVRWKENGCTTCTICTRFGESLTGCVQLFAQLVRCSSTTRLFALVGKKNPLCTP